MNEIENRFIEEVSNHFDFLNSQVDWVEREK